MQILLIGKGAREHALAWKLSQSQKVRQLYVWPGNPAMDNCGVAFPLSTDATHEAVAKKAMDFGIDLTVCGPEVPLAQGLADIFAKYGLRFFGPCKEAARLESSKSFAKDLMKSAGIPTAESVLTHSGAHCLAVAGDFLSRDEKVVLKADGLAAGKGVIICDSENTLRQAVEHYFPSDSEQGAVPVLVERFLSGRECSWFALLGSGEPLELGFAVDFKRVSDGDQGPNTGGMGSYTPVPWLPDDASDQIQVRILNPLLKELAARKIQYTGFLYVGLIWTQDGPHVIEYNVRLGDPEAQVLAVQDSRDWVELMLSRCDPEPSKVGHQHPDSSLRTVGIVMASPSYPDPEPSALEGQPLPVFRKTETDRWNRLNVQVFAASVRETSEGLAPGTGRVLTVVARGKDFDDARLKALQCCEELKKDWPEAKWRTDIGLRASLEEKSACV